MQSVDVTQTPKLFTSPPLHDLVDEIEDVVVVVVRVVVVEVVEVVVVRVVVVVCCGSTLVRDVVGKLKVVLELGKRFVVVAEVLGIEIEVKPVVLDN